MASPQVSDTDLVGRKKVFNFERERGMKPFVACPTIALKS
jgi:hypothetical protein